MKQAVESARKLGLRVKSRSMYLILDKLKELKYGNYVECGVYKGNTIVTAAIHSPHWNFYGFDTFGGFPKGGVNSKDEPDAFYHLYGTGKIDKEHFDKANKRTGNFQNWFHLDRRCLKLGRDRGVFKLAKDHNIKLYKGSFNDTLKEFSKPIHILFLDCDLYNSYKTCLQILYPQVVKGGVIILDEYKSINYPGPRLACDEFFSAKKGRIEGHMNREIDDMAWCWIKEEP